MKALKKVNVDVFLPTTAGLRTSSTGYRGHYASRVQNDSETLRRSANMYVPAWCGHEWENLHASRSCDSHILIVVEIGSSCRVAHERHCEC